MSDLAARPVTRATPILTQDPKYYADAIDWPSKCEWSLQAKPDVKMDDNYPHRHDKQNCSLSLMNIINESALD